MRPLDRPRTVSPDVSMFISPADPEDLIEVDEIDEVPYVPHVPIKPPPPARFANRRKLYDDSVPQVEPDFGDGIVQGSTNDLPLKDETPAEGIPNQSREKPADESHKPVRDNQRSRRGRREQTGEPEATQRPGNNAAPPIDDPTPNGAPMQVEGLTRLSDLMRHKVSQEQMLAGRVLRRAENPLT